MAEPFMTIKFSVLTLRLWKRLNADGVPYFFVDTSDGTVLHNPPDVYLFALGEGGGVYSVSCGTLGDAHVIVLGEMCVEPIDHHFHDVLSSMMQAANSSEWNAQFD